MMVEIWNRELTDKSWELLQKLRKNYDFVLIGGWAVYLYTNMLKSKDIDLVVNHEELQRMRYNMNFKKNERLRKYELKVGLIDIDIYVPYWSDLIVPPEDILTDYIFVGGFKVISPEKLLLLKIDAEMDRKKSIKGMKDRADIISLLISGEIDKGALRENIKKYGKKEHLDELIRIVAGAKDEFQYLGIKNPREIKKLKQEIKEHLEGIRASIQKTRDFELSL